MARHVDHHISQLRKPNASLEFETVTGFSLFHLHNGTGGQPESLLLDTRPRPQSRPDRAIPTPSKTLSAE